MPPAVEHTLIGAARLRGLSMKRPCPRCSGEGELIDEAGTARAKPGDLGPFYMVCPKCRGEGSRRAARRHALSKHWNTFCILALAGWFSLACWALWEGIFFLRERWG